MQPPHDSGLVPFEVLGETLEMPSGPVTFRSRLDALLAAGFFIEPDHPATESHDPHQPAPRLTISELMGGPELLL